MKQMLKLAVTLALFASIACVLLAFVNNATLPAIQETKMKALKSGLQEIFAEADDFTQINNFPLQSIDGVKLENMYIAKKDNSVIGIIVQATGPTYDKATILTGLTTSRTIKSIKILSISDTSGFGQNATKPEFYTQFADKSIDDKFSPTEDIDGLSGATITRTGVSKILKVSTSEAQKALEAYVAGESK